MNASFLLRLKAFLFDYALISVYLIVLVIVSSWLYPPLRQLFEASLIIAQMSGFIFVTLPVSLYFIIFDSIIGKQSFGKKKVGIQVVGKNGEAISLVRNCYRTFLKFLPWELSHFLVYRLVNFSNDEFPFVYYMLGGVIYLLIFLYIFTAILTKRKQALYDLLAKTEVVKVK